MNDYVFDRRSRCAGSPWWSRGHRFEPRYDKRLKANSRDDWFWTTTTTTGPISAEMIEAAKDSITYVHDVCVRCGMTIERARLKVTGTVAP